MTKTELLEQIKEGKSIIKFGAQWCGPCKTMSPILDAIKEQSDINIIDIDIDVLPELTAEFGVRNIPTTYFYKDGTEINKVAGLISAIKIYEIFD